MGDSIQQQDGAGFPALLAHLFLHSLDECLRLCKVGTLLEVHVHSQRGYLTILNCQVPKQPGLANPALADQAQDLIAR
jgi:hypothetical protein